MDIDSSNQGIAGTGLVLMDAEDIPEFMDWNLTGGNTLGQRLAKRLKVGTWEFRSLVPLGTPKHRAGRFRTGGLVTGPVSLKAAAALIVEALTIHAPGVFLAEDRLLPVSYPAFASHKRSTTITLDEEVYESATTRSATIDSVIADLRHADAGWTLNCAVSPVPTPYRHRPSESIQFISDTAATATLILTQAYDGESFLIARHQPESPSSQ